MNRTSVSGCMRTRRRFISTFYVSRIMKSPVSKKDLVTDRGKYLK